MCQTHGISDNDEQLDLLRLLKDLGIAFNYGSKENPANTNVLKPEWVTKGIYAIINENKFFQQEGKVNLTDLKDVLVPKRDYARKEPVIMGLMDQFDLCFPLREGEYLIPDLLPKKQPYLGTQFEDSLRLQYQYELLPRSIMPQFICRMHETAKQYWLHGVIIQEGKNDALIQVNYEKHTVSIAVNGPRESRRALLDKIRSHFTILNDQIKGKAPKMLVPLPDNPEIAVSYALLIQAERAGDQTIRVENAGLVVVKDLLDCVVNEVERVLTSHPEWHINQSIDLAGDKILSRIHEKEARKEKASIAQHELTKNQNSSFGVPSGH